MDKLPKSLLKFKAGVTMDAIRIHPGPFTDQDSLAKLLELFHFDVQDITTKKRQTKLAHLTKQSYGNRVLCVGSKQFRFKESKLFNYWIYVEEGPATSTSRNDVAEMITDQDHRMFGEAIAIRRLKSKGSKATKKGDLEEFATELMRVGSVDDALVTFPMRPHSKMWSEFPKLKNMGKLQVGVL